MIWWSTLVMAQREIRRNTMRSTLTALGIVIGVASVIAMVTLGQGATARVTADITNLGNNLLLVFPGSQRRGPTAVGAAPFTTADARAISREVASVAAVAPTASRSVLAVFGGRNHNTVAQGSTNEFFQVRNYAIGSGRMFSDLELQGGPPVCILGATVRRELFGSQDPVGTVIRAGRLSCRVIGTMVSKGAATFGGDQDDLIVIPLVTVQRRLLGTTDVNAIYVSAVNARSTTRAKRQLEELFRERRHIPVGQEPDFIVQDMKEITKTLGTVTGVLTALLGAIAAVSLLVGGIGIMNIMLVSVTERTREIGIRLAIGALGREVLFQFLVEAVVLSTFGGALGVALGLGLSLLATRALSLPLVLVPEMIVVALLFSAAVGIGFGYFPARKAARLNPIDALRHE